MDGYVFEGFQRCQSLFHNTVFIDNSIFNNNFSIHAQDNLITAICIKNISMQYFYITYRAISAKPAT